MRTILITWIFALSQMASAAATDVKAGNQMSGMFFKENHTLNYGFEGNNENNVTDSSSIATVSSSSPISGTYSLGIDATTSGQLVKILGKAIKQVGSNCEADFYYSGDASLYKAYVLQSSTQVSSTYNLANVGTNVQSVNMFFPCGAGTAPDITIEATSNSAAAIKVDDFYSGQPMNIGTVAQASFVGSLKYAGVTSCQWSTSSTSFAAFAADTDCNTPTVTGSATAPGTKIPGVVFSNLAPGTYRVVANFGVGKTGTQDAVVSMALNDGTTTSAGKTFYNGTANGTVVAPATVEGYFTYTTAQSSVTFQVYGYSQNASNNALIEMGNTNRDFEISVEYFPTSAQAAITPNQQRAPTIQKFTSGSGTYTTPAGVTYIQVRMVGGGGGGSGVSNGVGYVNGSSGGTTTFGTLTAIGGGGAVAAVPGDGGSGGTGTVDLRLSGGQGQGGGDGTAYGSSGGHGGGTYFGGGGAGGGGGSDGGNGKPNTGAGGGGAGGKVSWSATPLAGGGGGEYVENIITSPSSSYSYAVGAGGAKGDGTSADGGTGGSGYIEVTEYYSQSAPILIGSVTSNTSGAERVERATITCSSSSSITSQSGSWITSVGNISSGVCTVTLPSGIFSSSPSCTVTHNASDPSVVSMNQLLVNSTTSLSYTCRYLNSGSSTVNNCGSASFNIICMGAR